MLFYVKDKNNMGNFGAELARYISSDEELDVLFDAYGGSFLHKNGFVYDLEMTDSNCWEVFITKPNGNSFAPMFELGSDKLSDAIFEVIDSIPELIKDI